MEALVQKKILSSLVNEVSVESAIIQPINVDIKKTNVTRMIQLNTMTTNDGNYFIRYGGFPNNGNYYNAIEVYSVNSLDNNSAVYTFTDLKIDNHIFYINKMKQSEDGRFYAAARYYDGNNFYSYLIIFNNFIQDGYCQVNKFYSNTSIGISDTFFYDIAKVENTGIYFIETENNLIKFEINVLEGNKTTTSLIVDGGTITSGSYQQQLNVFKDKLILTKLWETDDYKYEYTKAIIDVNEYLPNTITLNRIYYTVLNSNQYIAGAKNQPYEAIIPFLTYETLIPYLTVAYLTIYKISIDGTVLELKNETTTFFNNNNLYSWAEDNYLIVTNGESIYLMYINEQNGSVNFIEFYEDDFDGYLSNLKLINQYNLVTLIGTKRENGNDYIVEIKNIYSPKVTSEPYYRDDFCLPYYMNLYQDENDNTSLIFSRDATARFYYGNQITSTFIVPNFLINDENIEKVSVYGKTNYVLNNVLQNYEKNKFESLYFNFIYSLNIIDNTKGLNNLNESASSRFANLLWDRFGDYTIRLTKARITYEDLTMEIIDLNIPIVTENNVTFSFEVTGNVTKIEYLSNDENTVYATFRTNLTGTNTITQTIRVE